MSDFPPEPGQPEPEPGPFDDPMKARQQAAIYNRKVKDILDGKVEPTPDTILQLLDLANSLNK